MRVQNGTVPIWPPGDNEMARLIRENDWSGTPLGPIAGWLQSLKTIVDLMLVHPLPMAVLWGPENITLYNDAYSVLLDVKHPVSLGRPLHEQRSDVRHINEPLIRRVFAGETVSFADTRHPNTLYGGIKGSSYDLALSPLREEAGLVAGVLLTVFETTERMRVRGERDMAEAALRESEERHRLAMAAVEAMVFDWDIPSGRVVRSEGLRRLLGYGPEEAVETTGWWAERIQPEDRARLGWAAREAMAAGAPRFVAQVRMRHRDGHWVDVLDTGIILYEADGRPHRIVGSSVDVTARARAEVALRESEELLRQFGEASSDVLWIRDAETLRWKYLSPAFEAIYGLSRERALGGDDLRHWAEFILPEDQEQAMQSLARVRDGEHVAFEYRIRRASDGEMRWMRDVDFPMRDHAGRVQRIGGIGRDVTNRKRDTERMEVLIAELQHRTRNLLGVVRSVARRSIPASVGRNEYDGRLAALGRVQGFLSRSPIYTVPLVDLVEAELMGTGNGASEKVKVGGPAVELPGEGLQTIALALHELATNAVKYGALGQPTGQLSITWRVEALSEKAEGDRLVVDWRESGVVMPVDPSARRGYGSDLITKALPFQLQAETELEFLHDGMRCRIVLPTGTFEVK